MAIEVRVLQDGTKRYVARVWDPVLGRKISKTLSRRRDAEKVEADMKVRMLTGERLERPKDVMFAEFADAVLSNTTAGESTLKEYKRINAVLSELIGRKSMRQVTPPPRH